MSVEYGLLERWRFSQMCQQQVTPHQPDADDRPRRFLELIDWHEPLDRPRADRAVVLKLTTDDR
jgi:hypothetical protein